MYHTQKKNTEEKKNCFEKNALCDARIYSGNLKRENGKSISKHEQKKHTYRQRLEDSRERDKDMAVEIESSESTVTLDFLNH